MCELKDYSAIITEIEKEYGSPFKFKYQGKYLKVEYFTNRCLIRLCCLEHYSDEEVKEYLRHTIDDWFNIPREGILSKFERFRKGMLDYYKIGIDEFNIDLAFKFFSEGLKKGRGK